MDGSLFALSCKAYDYLNWRSDVRNPVCWTKGRTFPAAAWTWGYYSPGSPKRRLTPKLTDAGEVCLPRTPASCIGAIPDG